MRPVGERADAGPGDLEVSLVEQGRRLERVVGPLAFEDPAGELRGPGRPFRQGDLVEGADHAGDSAEQTALQVDHNRDLHLGRFDNLHGAAD